MPADRAVAIVTGGSRGIGAHTAARLAGRGHPVAICSTTDDAAAEAAAQLEESFDVATFGANVDLTDLGASSRFVADTVDRLGPPLVLVNNAGWLGPVGPLETCDLEAWRRCVDVNLTSAAAMTAHCLPFMRAAGWGRVVNLAGGGVGGPDAAVGVSAYTAAKAAVVMLTETVGLEVTDSGVVVTAIAPGTIDTGFMGVVLAAPSTTTPSTLVEMAHRQNDDPDDIAPFLALLDHILDSDAASLNGRMLSARWENPEALTEMGDTLATRPSRFRLRRIDGALYGELTER